MNTTELDLLCWCWKNKALGNVLTTTNGQSIEVIDQGLYNRNRYGQFFNAKIKTDGLLFVGNVVVVNMSSDFFQTIDYKHESGNVILVLCYISTQQCLSVGGRVIPTIQVEIPKNIETNAWDLIDRSKGQQLCKGHIVEYSPRLTRHAWLSAMLTEWLEEVTARMGRYHKDERMEVLDIVFNQILRGFGFAVNETAMDLLARAIPVHVLLKHANNLFQIEAIIFGQAGLLVTEDTVQDALLDKYRDRALVEGYFTKLRNEWMYLSRKYDMSCCISRLVWKPFGKGGLNYPHVFLSMLANWLYMNLNLKIVENIMSIRTAKEAANLFNTHCTPYWQTHNHFGLENKKCMKCLSRDRRSFLTMAVVPTLMFFYGQLRKNEDLCDHAFAIIEQVKAFRTTEGQGFADYGFCPNDAEEVMAMVWMQHRYCDENRCLHCRFGLEYIKKH